MTDVPGDATTDVTIEVGGFYSGELEIAGDHDWIALNLAAGQTVTISLSGTFDTYLNLFDSNGAFLDSNDDSNGTLNSEVTFTANSDGLVYIDVGAYADEYSGTYDLTVTPIAPPPPPPPTPIGTVDDMANQLTSGFWAGDEHHFDVTQGGTITVDFSALTDEGQNYARVALSLWSDILGITFSEVTTNGQITFDDADDGAYSYSSYYDGLINSSFVNVSTTWLTDYGDGGLDNYVMQAYIHEIGHALGLGHGGNYNSTADYSQDALFLTDGWPMTVMSYFSQSDNTYYSSLGFTYAYLMTPMLADIVAMQHLYGVSTATRVDDTVYGFNSTAGRDAFDATLYPNAAYTIVDSGGIDTMDYSGFTAEQRINLNQETFSNIGGSVGNVSIGRGTVIENAIGGSGDDTIVANDADNVLDGGAGSNTISYELADARVVVDLRISTAQNTRGSGIDTLVNFNTLIGSAFNDVLIGVVGGTVLGGAGDDRIFAFGSGTLDGQDGDDTFSVQSLGATIIGGAGFDAVDLHALTSGAAYVFDPTIESVIGTRFNDTLTGNAADNLLNGGAGNDMLDGGDGNDTASYVGAAAVSVALGVTTAQNTGGAGIDTLVSIENLIGSGYGDTLTGDATANALFGMGGSDRLYGGAGDDVLDGGAGDDRLEGGAGVDTASYASATSGVFVLLGNGSAQNTVGAGVDTLRLIENLTGSAFADRLYGNAGANVIDGGGGNDRINGGAGADRMVGGTGNDTYVVDDVRDTAVENAGEGLDLVVSSVSYTLGDNVEWLQLTGSATSATGNDLTNYLIGNAQNNVLDGGGGIDTLRGGAGDDIYYVDNIRERIMEYAGQGHDTVYASDSYVLGDNVEDLVLTGSAALNALGNALDNVITGNDGANVLTGGAGRDTLTGGLGADRFRFREGDTAGLTSATFDRIRDFSQADHDRIDLSGIDANRLIAGDQAFTFIGTEAFHHVAGELRYATADGITLVSGDTDGDGIADFLIRCDGTITFTSTDFMF